MNSLKQRVTELEKRVAELEGRVQEQPGRRLLVRKTKPILNNFMLNHSVIPKGSKIYPFGG
ncbi:hypothetical protein SAMN00017405_0424 [Desulfonispora thiosulfatigenes DSM 11270]|uniref:Uncharacterized protein n=1 Tax=Desulfonispora thiosulfatigenes DSM 11270 TaxID=656914 RepID=A0A1W1VQ83_DESTI|nr:hypothetical protein [Desulfonispora thiosulfatigenes]SMB95535.1 hypothetical protein SAMN00017405_0424 [Desulfonispora thiosulfatigenes DSM 11270]